MQSIFRNPEFKSIITKLIVLQLLFALVIYVFMQLQLTQLNQAIVERNTALAGKILTRHPELADEIAGYFTKQVTPAEVQRGENLLQQYGYTENMSFSLEPNLQGNYHHLQWASILLALLYSVPLLFLIFREYRKLYVQVRQISSASEAVIDGDFSTILPEDAEGEFAMLGHHFNLMANRLKLSMERLQEDKVFLKNIMSDISHQLKTPLSSLKVFNELMLENGQLSSAVSQDFLEKSRTQLNRMEWLTLNLLKLARLEAGAIDFQIQHISLLNPVNKALDTLKLKADEKQQRIICQVKGNQVCFHGDEEWTAEALINILKNCIEHTAVGGQIFIELEETPLISRVIIRDNGEGIAKQDLPRIFERFYQGSSSVKVESVGIGLALAKQIIEGQNGNISVQSEKGKGTEFTIIFLKGVI